MPIDTYSHDDIVVALAGTIRNNPSLGDEIPDIRDVEQHGTGSVRLKLSNGQIFILRVREEA